jgi:hypothetical protein
MTSHGWWCSIAITCALLSGAACAGAPRQKPLPLGTPDTGAGTVAQARKYLEGRWSLVSLDVFPPNERPIHAVGSGTLIYDEFANMTVDMKVDNATALLFEQVGIPVRNGVVSTKGKTLVDMTGRTLSYVLDGQAIIRPATHPLDTNRPRHWEVNGDTLTLRTKDDKGTDLSVAVWKKGGSG